MALVFALIKGLPSQGSQLPFQTKAHINKLSKHLGNAQQVVASQRLVDGSTANSFIAPVRFPGENIIATLDPTFLQSVVAAPVTLSGALGEGELHLRFALRGGVLYVAARNDTLQPDLFEVTHNNQQRLRPQSSDITIGFVGVDSNLLMHYRDLSMIINGPWEPAFSGMLHLMKGKSAAAQALARGILCVFWVHNSKQKQSNQIAN